jgi:hypothetical protein
MEHRQKPLLRRREEQEGTFPAMKEKHVQNFREGRTSGTSKYLKGY